MRDSKLIVNMSRGVTHKGLFSYVLPRIAGAIFMAGLTVWGFLSATTPTAHKFYEWLDNIDQVAATAFACAGLGVVGIWLIWFRRK